MNDEFSIKIPIEEMNAKKLGITIRSTVKRPLFLLCPNEQAILDFISDNEIYQWFSIENKVESAKSGVIGMIVGTHIIYVPREEKVFTCCSNVGDKGEDASKIVKKLDNLLRKRMSYKCDD